MNDVTVNFTIDDAELAAFEQFKAMKAEEAKSAEINAAIEAKECQAFLAMRAGKYPHEIDANAITEQDLSDFRADKAARALAEAEAHAQAEAALFQDFIKDKVKIRLIYEHPVGDMVDMYGIRFVRDGLELYGYTEPENASVLEADGLAEIING